MSMLDMRMGQLREMDEVQSRLGNWNVSAYNHGLANGIKLALAIMSGSEPKYLKEPPEGYAGLGSKALVSKAVKVQPPSPATVEPDYQPATDAPAPISPERLGEIPASERGIGALIKDVHGKLADRMAPYGGVAAKAQDDVDAAQKVIDRNQREMGKQTIRAAEEKEPMAKKPKPAPKKPAKVAGKGKPIAKAKAKGTKKASVRKAKPINGRRKSASFKGATKRGKGRAGKARAR